MDIGIITNPNARKNKLHPERAGELARLVGDAGVVVQTKQLADIKPAIRSFLAELKGAPQPLEHVGRSIRRLFLKSNHKR